jgi:hypothetical protein
MPLAPWLAFLAAITSFVLLVFRTLADERSRSWLAALWAVFLAAAYFQFLGRSDLVSALGLAAQTLLAVVLLVWWKLET